MKKLHAVLSVIFFLSSLFFSIPLLSQAPAGPIKLHVNCSSCDMNYIRQEMPYVAHVRDMALADVQIFINRINNASGGETYEISITGPSGEQELVFHSTATMTRDEVREGLLKYMVAGLAPYLIDSGLDEEMSIQVQTATDTLGIQPVIEIEDPWNYWVFEVWSEIDLEMESLSSEFDTENGFSADRITEDWRFTSFTEFNYGKEVYEREEGDIINIQRRHFFRGRLVKSLSTHWSTGLFAELDHDTYRNTQFAWEVAPAVEYSIFPYREVIRREITLAYRIGYQNIRYIEETIYDEIQQGLFRQSLSVNVRYRQPWGTIFSRLEASNLLNDFSKHRFEFEGSLSIRIFKGLAVQCYSDLQLIRDQISLPKDDASLEDQLLRQRQIATDFEMRVGIGLRYTFGSAYNNIVNTRL